MKNIVLSSFIFPLALLIIVSIFCIPFIYANNQNVILSVESNLNNLNSQNSFLWPTSQYKSITSAFGYRKSPASGASTYHGGIDIGAPQGTPILATIGGTISYIGFNGANGYTVKIKSKDGIEITYGHVSPNFVVSKGDEVVQGQQIANVGPKYVEKKSYTIYTDSTGKCTNGATTGPHLHFAISKDGKKIDPQQFF